MSITVAEEVVFPVYVLAKDCGEVFRFENPRELNYLEAIDVANNEYEAWDAERRVLRLIASNIGIFRAGEIAVGNAGQSLDVTRFKQLTEIAIHKVG